MRKYILAIILLLLIPYYAYSAGMFGVENPAKAFGVTAPDKAFGVSGLQGGGGACETGATAIDHVTATTSGGTTEITTTQNRGNSFVYSPGVDYSIYSINIVRGGGGSAANIEIRIGASTDLSEGNYIAKGTVATTANGTFEVIMESNPTLTSGTTYYFGVAASISGVYLDKATEAYSGGARLDGTNWSMSAVSGDIRFLIKECN